MNDYAARNFTASYLEVDDYRYRPLPDADALAELDTDLAGLPVKVSDAEQAARAAVADYNATRFASPQMRALAADIAAAVASRRPTTDLEADLARTQRSGPDRLARAVALVAAAKHTRAEARARVEAALEENMAELGAVRAALAREIHDHAVAADRAGDTHDGLEWRTKLAEADQRWGRIVGLQEYAARRPYRAHRGCPSAALDWQPGEPSTITSVRGSLLQRVIGAKA